MLYQTALNNWPDVDPAPNVPTLAELQLADELRRLLVGRLLAGVPVATLSGQSECAIHSSAQDAATGVGAPVRLERTAIIATPIPQHA